MRRYFFLVILFLFSGCYQEHRLKGEKPERLLPEDTFVMVLTHIQLADGAVEYQREHHHYKPNDNDRYYSYIYQKFHLTPKELKDNLDYYNSDPVKMEQLYDKALALLTEIQGNLEVQQKIREQKIKDSLAKLDTNHYVRIKINFKPKKEPTLKEIWPTPW